MIRRMGVEFRTGVTFGQDITLESLKQDGFKAVFLAIGPHGGRRLGVENEDVAGVLQGVDFLRDAALGKQVEIGDRRAGGRRRQRGRRRGAHRQAAGGEERDPGLPRAARGDARLDSRGPGGPRERHPDRQQLRPQGVLHRQEQARLGPGVQDLHRRLRREPPLQPAVRRERLHPDVRRHGDRRDRPEHRPRAPGRPGHRFLPSRRPSGRPGHARRPTIEGIFAGGDAFHGPKSVVEAIASGKQAAEIIAPLHQRPGYARGAATRSGSM